MHRLLSNPPRSNGIGSLSPTPKRITRSPHDEEHLRSLQSGLYGDLQISPDFGEFGREDLPKMLTEYPEKGVLLTSAVESDGGNGFSALESPHVMPTGASQHHHSMRENALFPPPWCFAEESARRGESRYTPPCQFRGHGASAAMAFRAKLRLSVQTCSPPPKFAPFPPLFATLTLRCGAAAWGSQDR